MSMDCGFIKVVPIGSAGRLGRLGLGDLVGSSPRSEEIVGGGLEPGG